MGYEVELTWKTPAQTLTLHKTSTGSLGIIIKTFSRETDAGLSSVTIVTRISPKCTIQDHRILDVNDRIVSIDGKPITKTCICTNDVFAILKAHKKQYITLGVCHVVKSSGDNHKFKETDKNVQLNVQVNSEQFLERPANLQRFSSLVSSDSGQGNSPTTGDLNGTFVFENNNNSEPVPCESVDKVRDKLTPALSDVRTPACQRQSDRQAIYSIPDENNIFRNSLDQFPPQCSVDLRDDPIQRSLSRNSGGSLQSHVRRPLSQNSDDLRRVHRTSSQSSGDSLTVNVHGEKCPRSGSSNSCSDNGSETQRSVECCSTCHSCFGAVSAVNKGSIAVVYGVAGTSHSDANCIHNHQTVCVCIQADVCTSCVDPYLSETVNSMPLEGFCVPDFYEDSPHHTRSLPLSPVASNHITNDCLCHQSVNLSGSFTDMAFVGVDNNKVVSMATSCTSKASCSDCLTIAQQILKYPQNVLWDPNTKVVTLNRGNKKTPLGVSFTHPFFKNKDGTVDAYTLVEHVDKGGAAEGKLFVGDWIRSVNGKPLHKAKKTSSVAALLELSETVRFVIQRPANMKRAQGDHKISPGKSCKHDNYSPSTDCSENFTTCHSSTINCDKSVVNNNRQTSNKHKRLERYISSSSRGSNNSGRQPSPNSPRSCTCENCGSGNLNRSVSSTGNCIDIFNLARRRSAMEENVKCPSMKLFVLGSHALRMTELLIPGSTQQLTAQGKEKFFHVSCLVREDTDGVTKLYLHEVRSVCENDLLSGSGVLSQGSEGNQTGICEEDIEFDIATQSGSEHLPRCFSGMTLRTQNSMTTTVNLDIFILTEEKFFNRCAPVLFSKNSLFFVTFDGGKVLDNTTEMSRIGQLVHEIRTNAGIDSPLFLYGFLDMDTSDAVSTCTKTDELKALFYTDHGRQILRYTNVAMPHFVTQSGNSLENACQSARKLIGRLVIQQEFLTGHLHLATLAAMSWIHQLRRQGCQLITMSDLREGIYSLISDIQPENLLKMIRELHSCGTILLTDECLNVDQMISLNQTVFIQPIQALQCLQSFLWELEKPVTRNSPRETTGVIHPISDTKMLLQKAFKATDCSKVKFNNFFALLWKFKLIHSVWNSHDNYWLTYFLPETQTCDNVDIAEEHVLYVRLDSFISAAVFLSFIHKLAEVCKAEMISGLSLNSGEIQLQVWGVRIEHMWTEDLIKFSFRMEKSNISLTSPPCGFVKNVVDALKSCLPFHLHYHVCVPCPLGEECEVSRGRRPHLIEILKKELQFCGNSRVDNLNAMTIWQDVIHQKEPGSKTNCHGNKGSNGGPPSPKEKKNFAWSTYVLNLPFDLLSALYLQLLIPMPVRGNDWHGFASCIGMTANKVALYQLQKNPAQELITDWSRVNRSTLRDLIDILSSPDMERIDLVDLIKDKINIL